MIRRGSLRVYLGAAPGVGKTYAMLDEGRRRADRGTDVVVGVVETHDRPHTAERLGDLPVLPRRTVLHRGAPLAELDLPALLDRRPEVALIDELAHTNAPGLEHAKRWQDVQALLEAGIDVITTVNVQHLESLNDVVREITGVGQGETVPDAVVRAADQVELVDMTPEALRRRMSHGNIYPPDRAAAALTNYFRPGNLTVLRELALLWLAGSVEEGLQRYRAQHGITGTWETKERIVVALTGGPEGDTLIRRAARIANRSSGGDLLAVHVARSDGLAGSPVAMLPAQRALVESLGGSFHSVVGDEVARAILDFARSVDATQVVLGASRRKPLLGVLSRPGTGQTVTRSAGSIDVHIVSHDYVGRGRNPPRLGYGLTLRRRLAGLVVGALLLAAVTAVLTATRAELSIASDLAAYMLVVVVTSLVGGFWPALLAAVAGGLLLNYYFAPPIHTFTIASRDNVIAVVVVVLVAVLVSQVVDRSARRSAMATRREAEAETLAALAHTLLTAERALPALLSRVQETFSMTSVSLLRRTTGSGPTARWEVLAASGSDAAANPDDGEATADIDAERVLVLRGHPLAADQQRLLAAFAADVAAAYEQRRLAVAARRAETLAETEKARTALLNAVSHDLRTPIAAARAAVSGLRSPEVHFSDADRAELLRSADTALTRLTDLVSNLLDLSRLRAGALPVTVRAVGVDDLLARTLDQLDADQPIVIEEFPDDLPLVSADPALAERVLVNLLQNALRYNPPGGPVRIAAATDGGMVHIAVSDHGRGVRPDQADRIFSAFVRGDTEREPGAGVGLGLAIARGLAEAMGGAVTVQQTPGGGATFVFALPSQRASHPVHPDDPAHPDDGGGQQP